MTARNWVLILLHLVAKVDALEIIEVEVIDVRLVVFFILLGNSSFWVRF